MNLESDGIQQRLKKKINPFSNNEDLPKVIDLNDYPEDLLLSFEQHMPYAMHKI